MTAPATPLTVVLPYPPSTNHRLRPAHGRLVLTEEARAYKYDAGTIALAAGLRPLTGRVVLTATFYRPRRIGDADNGIKVLLDSLKGVAYRDDNQIVELHIYREDDPKAPRVEVIVEAKT